MKFLFPCCIAFLILLSCSEEEEPIIICDGTLMLTVTEVSNSGCEDATGEVTVEALGGAGNYAYRIDVGPFTSSNNFTQLQAGLHQISMRDGNNCIETLDQSIATGITLGNIRGIILSNCAISGCHNGNRNDIPDYNNDSEILSRAVLIQTRTADRTMPPPGTSTSLTDAEIRLISCWANDGGPE